jgi:hypothetical protein
MGSKFIQDYLEKKSKKFSSINEKLYDEKYEVFVEK